MSLFNKHQNPSCLFQSVKVKLSRYRPGQALGVRGVWGSRISRQSAHEDGKVVSPRHRPSLPPEMIPGWVDPRSTMRPEGLSHWKIRDSIGNRTRDLPVCSAVPQPTAPPRTPSFSLCIYLFHVYYNVGLLSCQVLELHHRQELCAQCCQHSHSRGFVLLLFPACIISSWIIRDISCSLWFWYRPWGLHMEYWGLFGRH
jgi:hypothetical protein